MYSCYYIVYKLYHTLFGYFIFYKIIIYNNCHFVLIGYIFRIHLPVPNFHPRIRKKNKKKTNNSPTQTDGLNINFINSCLYNYVNSERDRERWRKLYKDW